MTTLVHHTSQSDAGRGIVAFTLAPDAADCLDEFMGHIRQLFIVTGDVREFDRSSDGVTYHVPVLPKGEIE